MKSPTVSVIMATYNHAAFVAQAIASVLNQREVEFEFLIADDGSSDTTRDVVAAIHDERIRFYPNTVNRGACTVTNELIARASGEFIALLNSDDYWIGTDKLAYQIRIMRDNPTLGACFGRAGFVDKDGRAIDKSMLPLGLIFDKQNRSRGKWLRYLFDHGNCICHPTMLIRKSCYDELGMYDNRLRQLPDMDMWVRLLKKHDINISNREMVAFRHLPGENASSSTSANYSRLLCETYFVLRGFFDGITREVFLEGFGDLLTQPNLLDDENLAIEQALIYFTNNRWASHIYNLIGLEKIHALLGNAEQKKILLAHYAIDDLAFHSIAATACTFDLVGATGNGLTSVKGTDLITEVKRRLLLRLPLKLQQALKFFIG